MTCFSTIPIMVILTFPLLHRIRGPLCQGLMD
jgi:hypothetical protein